jgi:hypothetical protein
MLESNRPGREISDKKLQFTTSATVRYDKARQVFRAGVQDSLIQDVPRKRRGLVVVWGSGRANPRGSYTIIAICSSFTPIPFL